METRARLLKQVEWLEGHLEQEQGALEDVRALLRRAEARREADRDHEHKWNRVLENLEVALADAKARINQWQTQLQAAERALESLTGEVSSPPLPPNKPAASDTAIETASADFLSLAEAIVEAPLAELGHFTLEQLAEVSRHLGRELTPESFPRYVRLVAHLECANQQRALSPEQDAEADRRQQQVLRVAVEKVLNQQFDAMSREEMELVLTSDELLMRNLHPGPCDERFRRLIAAGMPLLRHRLQARQ